MRSTLLQCPDLTIYPTSRRARNSMPAEVRVTGQELALETADTNGALDGTWPSRGKSTWAGGTGAPERYSNRLRAGAATSAWHAKMFDCGASDIYLEARFHRGGATAAQTFARLWFRGQDNVFSPANTWIFGPDIAASAINGGVVVGGVYTSSYSGGVLADDDKFAVYCKNETIVFLQNDVALTRIKSPTFMHCTVVGIMMYNVAATSQAPYGYGFRGQPSGNPR